MLIVKYQSSYFGWAANDKSDPNYGTIGLQAGHDLFEKKSKTASLETNVPDDERDSNTINVDSDHWQIEADTVDLTKTNNTNNDEYSAAAPNNNKLRISIKKQKKTSSSDQQQPPQQPQQQLHHHHQNTKLVEEDGEEDEEESNPNQTHSTHGNYIPFTKRRRAEIPRYHPPFVSIPSSAINTPTTNESLPNSTLSNTAAFKKNNNEPIVQERKDQEQIPQGNQIEEQQQQPEEHQNQQQLEDQQIQQQIQQQVQNNQFQNQFQQEQILQEEQQPTQTNHGSISSILND